MLSKHVSFGNILGAHVGFAKHMLLESFSSKTCGSAPQSLASFDLRRFEKTHIGSIRLGAERFTF
ncbi:hypothetical protein YSY43_18230 [Paenibacillus sp. YSY-4.3]